MEVLLATYWPKNYMKKQGRKKEGKKRETIEFLFGCEDVAALWTTHFFSACIHGDNLENFVTVHSLNLL